MSEGDSVKVAIRVRPLNDREKAISVGVCISMRGNQVTLAPHGHRLTKPKSFGFDHCFDTIDSSAKIYHTQLNVFDSLGPNILDNTFKGYNACLFAYGQTGSGKSYTMMGKANDPEERGVIPRLCDSLFDRINQLQVDRNDITCTVEVSYMEIYNETVKDLFLPRVNQKKLRIRSHDILGPYVEDLSKLAVRSSQEIEQLMEEGNKSRTVASTAMNPESSRSHAVFTLEVRQTEFDPDRNIGVERVSRIRLVDLAGSERASKTGAEGDRLKEGSSINLSLTTLGQVISVLADVSSGKKTKDHYVPYRDSVLTWLLKDSLGGNSKTIMIATISPSYDNHDEILSTLRYADRAKQIVNHAIVNEDDNSKAIRELKDEVERLRELLKQGGNIQDGDYQGNSALIEKLNNSEYLFNQMNQTWEQKLKKTEEIHKERQKILEQMGISVQKSGIQIAAGHFYLVNMNADPQMNELLVYNLKETTMIGLPNQIAPPDIQLKGIGIKSSHCLVEIIDQVCTITPQNKSITCVNGKEIKEPTRLYHGSRLLLGHNHWFRVNAPGGHAIPPEGESEIFDINRAANERAVSIQQSMENYLTADERDKVIREQREDYERQINSLKDQLSGRQEVTVENYQGQSGIDAQLLTRLQEAYMKVDSMIREANSFSDALGKSVKFKATLKIDASYLSPRSKHIQRRDIAECLSVRVIFVSKGVDTVWSVECMEEKLIMIRELYDCFEAHKEKANGDSTNFWKENIGPDPFCDLESHSLLGVANVQLYCLFNYIEFNYEAPILSPQGNNIGVLRITIERLYQNQINEYDQDDAFGNNSSCTGSSYSGVNEMLPGAQLCVRVDIKEAVGLPPSIEFIFCQFRFIGVDDKKHITVPSTDKTNGIQDGETVLFNHSEQYNLILTEEFIENCREGVLPIEIFGHRLSALSRNEEPNPTPNPTNQFEKKWESVRNYVSMEVEILELNIDGEYVPVELKETTKDVSTGGVYQLKQGLSRKIRVTAQLVPSRGTLKLGSIQGLEIGSINIASKQEVGLDSYQESENTILKERWNEALCLRRDYLDNEMRRIMDKRVKTAEDLHKESTLISDWLALQQERNLLNETDDFLPKSKVWRVPIGFESRNPLIFLNLDCNNSTNYHDSAILKGEKNEHMLPLAFKYESEQKLQVVATWDAGVHDNRELIVKSTSKTDKIYLIVRIVLQLNYPPGHKVVLRKRISVRISKNTAGFFDAFRAKDKAVQTGVLYEIISGLPYTEGAPLCIEQHPSILEPEPDESIVQAFRRGMEEITNQLHLDRLKQEIVLKESQKKGVHYFAGLRQNDNSSIRASSNSPQSTVDDSGVESPVPEDLPSIVVTPSIPRPTGNFFSMETNNATFHYGYVSPPVKLSDEWDIVETPTPNSNDNDLGNYTDPIDIVTPVENIMLNNSNYVITPTHISLSTSKTYPNFCDSKIFTQNYVGINGPQMADNTIPDNIYLNGETNSNTMSYHIGFADINTDSKLETEENLMSPTIPEVTISRNSIHKSGLMTPSGSVDNINVLSDEASSLPDIRNHYTANDVSNDSPPLNPIDPSYLPSQNVQKTKSDDLTLSTKSNPTPEIRRTYTPESPITTPKLARRELNSKPLAKKQSNPSQPVPSSYYTQSNRKPNYYKTFSNSATSTRQTAAKKVDVIPPKMKRCSTPSSTSTSTPLNTSLSGRLTSPQLSSRLRVTEKVIVETNSGRQLVATVRYVGEFHAANRDKSDWVGVELLEPLGKNNGTVDGKFYFRCKPNYGMFVNINKITRPPSTNRPSSRASTTPTPLRCVTPQN